MSSLRRSSRSRTPAKSIYDEAKDVIDSSKKRAEEEEEEEEEEQEEEEEDQSDNESEEEMMDEDTDEQEETDEDDEDYAKPTRKFNPRSSLASSPKKQTKRNSRQQKSATKVQFHPSSNKHTKSAPPNKRSANPTKRTKSNALSTLARKVLDSSETPKTSLVAGLLSSFRPMAESDSDSATYVVLEDDHCSQPRTMYTPQLKQLAREVVELHNSDPNKAQVQLINLMFRSVGGGVESNLDPERTVMEDMDSDMWDESTTKVFVDMQEATSDRILFHSDPMGAVHAEQLEKKRDKAEHVETSSVGVTPSSLGVREYRKIYEEFWYILGEIALTEGNMSSISGKYREDDRDEESSDDEEESSNGGRKRKKRQSSSSRKRKRDVNTNFSSTIRFDTNLAQDLLNYVTNLTSTGQSDMRAVSSTAAFFIAHAVIDKTLLIEEKLGTAAKQYLSATRTSKKDNLSERAESLKNQIDSLKRSRADLDELIISSVLSGVFAFRYRDTNMFIRASCLQALARMMVRRPDKFLATTYLKYFGWMMNDKDDCVRVAALEGLHRPFQQCETAEQVGNEKIDLSQMTDLFAKYLPRIAQCNRDVSASVQERAMQLLLSLCKEGFLEEIENDDFFDSIFLYAVDKNASPTVRRDALYFVMLQMEIFDTEVLTSNEGKNEKIRLRRLDEIASWAADTLTSTNVPIGKIKVELVDYLVYSLRQMPEHKRLVTDFSIMLRTIQNDNSVINHSGNASGDKADVAKQRILVQMLTCAIEAEVQTVVSPTFLEGDREPLVSEVELAALPGIVEKKSSVKASRDLRHEHISVVLMKALPGLLEKFKSDVSISRSLCKVPRYLIPSVFSLPQRKTDFIALTKILSEIFLQSTDSDVLDNIIRSLMHLSKDGHSRSLEGKLAFRKIISGLCRCIESQLCTRNDVENENASPRRRSSRNSQVSSNRSEVDAELSLYYDLQRLSSLARSLDILNCRSDDDKHVFDKICTIVADGLTKRLDEGKSILHDEDASESSISSHVSETDSTHSAVTAATVEQGLLLLLYALAWSLKKSISDEGVVLVGDNDSTGQTEEDYSTHKVLILRNQLISLVEKCFDQRLIEGKGSYTSAKKIWSTRIQHSGSVIAADIRTLFPKEWSNADSAFLRSVALINDQKLIGGFTLFFRSQENDELRCNHDVEIGEEKSVRHYLLPFARLLCANWKVGNRAVAGYALAHATGSGMEASEIITALSRVLKKVEPVRLLEAQMASLRVSFTDWTENEPEEIEDPYPTDEMLANFQLAEERHAKELHSLVSRASKFSRSLGVRKLNGDLASGILGFVREGIRFSFSNSEEFMPGSRLPFLRVLEKYASWVKRNKEHMNIIAKDIDDGELMLKEDEEFENIHKDDLSALKDFRLALGIEQSDILFPEDATIFELESTQTTATSNKAMFHLESEITTPSVSRSTVTGRDANFSGTSVASKTGSMRSMISSVQTLSPLLEGDGSEESSTQQSRNQSQVTLQKTQSTFDGEISSTAGSEIGSMK